MPTYAIVESGGKQYRVEQGQSLLVDRLPEDEGAKVALRAVMLRTDDDVVLATNDLEKVKVEATIAGHERGEKVKVFKYKPKKGYRRRAGHRSELTRLEVTEVKMLGRKPSSGQQTADGKQQTAGSKQQAASGRKKAEAGADAAEAGKAERKKAPAKAEAEKAAKKPAAKQASAKEPAAKKAPAQKPDAEEAEAKGGLPKEIGKPATRALSEAGLTTLEQVAARTEEELLALHGIGPKAVGVLTEALRAQGMSLKQTDESKESD